MRWDGDDRAMTTQRFPMVPSAELTEVADRLVTERRRLSGLIARLCAAQPDSWSGVVDPPFAGVAPHPADQASDTFAREAAATLLDDVRLELRDVDRAIRKWETGAYGRCERCHEPIDDARLEALPAARFCVRDEERVELGDGQLTGLTEWAPDAEPASRSGRLVLWAGALQDDDGEPVDELGAEDAAVTVRDLLELEDEEGWGAVLSAAGPATNGGRR
jgi:RNA polymerase-binding transcription factor DksA